MPDAEAVSPLAAQGVGLLGLRARLGAAALGHQPDRRP